MASGSEDPHYIIVMVRQAHHDNITQHDKELSHHPAVFVDECGSVAADEVEQGCAVADVLGDVAGPGGDGIGVKGAGIPAQEEP